MIKQQFTFYNGVAIPAQGLGTYQIPNEQTADVVSEAISLGYRHIDTAAAYENEEGVGKGLRASGLGRSEIFVTSKIRAELKTYALARQAISDSLAALGTPYIDLMLIHAPKPWDLMDSCDKDFLEENLAVWKALEEAYLDGRLRAIGVSNFSIEEVDYLTNHSAHKPMANQIYCNITHCPTQLIKDCQDRGIVVEAYSPNDTGNLKAEGLEEIARRYDYSVPQLANRFDYQLGTVVLPKSVHRRYLIENLAIDTPISESSMKELQRFNTES